MPVTKHFVMLGSFLALSLTFSTVSAAQDLSANQASAPAEDRILVERDRVGNERREQAKSFIEHIEIGRSHEQAARWVDRICPKVVGIEGEVAERLVARVRNVAEAIGARVAPEGCSANISIALVDDGAQFVDAVHRKNRRSLRGVPSHKLEFVRNSEAPVRWWYTTEVFGSGGRPLQDSEPAFISTLCGSDCPSGQFLPAGRDPRFISGFNATRIGSFYERQIRAAHVVIDVNRAAGSNVASLADYVSLVALSEIWPDSTGNPSNSILSLFEADPEMDRDIRTLSSMDQQFLCVLYEMPLDRSARRQENSILRALMNDETDCFVPSGLE